MRSVRVGKVTTSRNGRLHLDIDGRAKCGSGRGAIITGTAIALDPNHVTLVCRHCRPAILAEADRVELRLANETSTGFNARAIEQARVLLDLLRTPAERATEAKRLEAVRAQYQQPAEGMTRVKVGSGFVDRPTRPLSGWGAWRAAMAAAGAAEAAA